MELKRDRVVSTTTTTRPFNRTTMELKQTRDGSILLVDALF